jgi:plasmid stability protein
MGLVLIRGVYDTVLQSLKERAAEHGRSLEAELRHVLTEAARNSAITRAIIAPAV